MTIKFVPRDDSSPEGKLADVELHFSGGPLDGLKLVGLAIWQRRDGHRNVTWPARSYSIDGSRNSFALLRPITEPAKQDRLRDLILNSYKELEATDALDPLNVEGKDSVEV